MKLATVAMTSLFISSAAAFSRSAGVSFARTVPRSASVRFMAMSSDPTEFAKAEIASNDIMVFSKSFCPYCKKTKKLLDGMNLAYTTIELDEIANGDAVQAALLDISGQRTVPNVFIKGVHLGGNDDTQSAAKSGKLQEMLK